MHIKSATFALEEAIPILYQRYTKGIQKAGNFFGTKAHFIAKTFVHIKKKHFLQGKNADNRKNTL